MAVFQYANNPQTTLSGAVNAATTTINVTSAVGFPAIGKFTIIVDSEIMVVTGVAGTAWTVERGAEDTAAAAHNTNAAVTGILTKKSFLDGPHFDVRAYGAVGNGVANDTATLQAAIDAAEAAGGGIVYLPPLSYRVTGMLVVNASGVIILGYGATITQATINTTILELSANKCGVEGVTFVQTATGATPSSGTSLEYGAAVSVRLASDCFVRNCRISDAGGVGGIGAGIWFSGATNCIAEGNHLSGGAIGINTDGFFGESGGNIIRGNRMVSTSRGIVVDLTGGSRTTSRGDRVLDNLIVTTVGVGIELDDIVNGVVCSGNRIKQAGGVGIKTLNSTEYGSITDNYIEGCGDSGILIGGGSNMTIANNTSLNNVNDGLQFTAPTQLVIHGNHFLVNGRHGILSDGTFPSNVTITDNVIRGNVGHGIQITDARDVLIAGNRIINNSRETTNTFDGVLLSQLSITPTNITVRGNTFYAQDTVTFPNSQRYSVNFTGPAATNVRLIDNRLEGSVTSPLNDASAALYRHGNTPGTFSNTEGSSGTAFPTLGLRANDRFHRSDLDLEYFYDGTRWLGVVLHDLAIPTTIAMPATATATMHRAMVPHATVHNLWLEKFQATFFVSGGSALDGSNFWTITLVKQPAGTTIATITINSGASGAWRTSAEQIINALVGLTEMELEVNVTKTGTPGNLFMSPYLTYRHVS